ncbi:MAG: hypothetical protein ABW056_03305 [Thermoanaerobaculia bacterium]
MLRSRILLMLLAMLPGAWLGAQVGPDPRENSFQFFVDGVVTQGVIGYRVEFNHDPQTRSDSRQLNTAYSPDNRRLAITVTQKGLNRLQGWLNDATSNNNPVSKNCAIVARDAQNVILARWELTNVQPATISSAGAGTLNEVTATIEFSYTTLTLVQAKPD